MTNKERLDSLSPAERRECMTQYFDHPLFKYIDWKAFFESENGNEMDFVMGEYAYSDICGEIIILGEEVRECEDYVYVYILSDKSFAVVPAPEPVSV